MRIDRIIEAEEIITLDPARPRARRMGVFAGRIAGFDEELDGVVAARTDRYDGVLVPGFIDAHCHATWWGLGLSAVDLAEPRGLPELYGALRERAARMDARRPFDPARDARDAEAWLRGVGFNDARHGGAPDIRVLDEIAPERPMYLRHASGHRSIVNTAALRLAGALEPGFRDPVGGQVLRDERGRPTGVLDETAQALVQRLLLPYSAEQIAGALDLATAAFARRGITSFTEAGVGGGWIGHSPCELEGYRLARASGRLHARAQLMPALDAMRPIRGAVADMHGAGEGLGLDLGIGAGFGDETLSLGPVKAFLDGSLLGGTAAVREEYCAHPHGHGYLLDDEHGYRERIDAVYRAGWPVALHAIGDRAIELAIGLIEECQARYGRRALPNRIEHCALARPEHLPRLARAGIAVTPQASFIGPIGSQMMRMVGPERAPWLYRMRSFLEAGVTVAGSSDLPVADGDVLRAMQSLVDRRTDEGELCPGAWEAVDAERALRCYTVEAAIGTGTVRDRGTLSTGKLADAAVLSASPLTAERIDGLQVVASYLAGRLPSEPAAEPTREGDER
ncbi:MAG: amidohydrolase [Pseudoclavibacter sp.]|nr:amidohydrolase [Pseudoclavibacter sp.]